MGASLAFKFAAVVATVTLNEAELSASCREHGLYPEALKAWRLACEQAHEPAKSQIVQARADSGLYLASESSFYHILKAANQNHRRGKQRPTHQRARPTKKQ